MIDSYSGGVVTSIKSVDLNSAIYRDAGRLAARINAYVDQLGNFDDADWAGKEILPENIIARSLTLAIPKSGASAAQQAAIDAARVRATQLGVSLRVIPF